MSWQFASFLLLALALVAGFAWYERSHPSARVLALVGTLAALAVLGRIAFAAVPNVKPTTDIVLIAGYVFGGAPGFAVGAVTGLVSNFFFTQGPWTPWQMGGWAAVGVIGALLARVGGERLGRVPLALVCGAAGLLFGAIVNFGSVVTVGGEDLAGRYLAFQALSLPWDLTHAVANVVFCLAFGPALVRTLRRFRARFEIRWRPASAPVVPLLVAVCAVALAAPAAAPSTASAATPVDYLERAQNRDGGFGGAPGQRSVDLFTGWVGLGLAAQGRNPQDVRRGGRSVIDFVRGRVDDLVAADSPEAVGDLERTILLVAAAGLSPRAFGGHDLVAALRRHIAADGAVLRQTNLTAFAVLALRAARVPRGAAPVRRATRWLVRQQNRDGGYGFVTRGSASDIDVTAAVVQALVAGGAPRAAVQRAVRFLRRHQNPDGGFPALPGIGSNAQSTSWAIQAFVAARVRPATVRRRGSRSPIAYLRSLRAPNGMIRFSRTSRQTPVWVTASGALGLARRPFPLRPAPRRARGAERPGDGEDGGGVLVPLAAAFGVVAGAGALVVRARGR